MNILFKTNNCHHGGPGPIVPVVPVIRPYSQGAQVLVQLAGAA